MGPAEEVTPPADVVAGAVPPAAATLAGTTDEGEASARPISRPRGLSLPARAWRDRMMLLLLLPGLLYFVVFHYVPLLGNVVAFEDYVPFIGFIDSPWVGLDNFQQMFADPRFWQALVNTLEITLLQLLFYFPAPILLALLISSVMTPWARRVIQSIVYLPHFISWVIIVALFQEMVGGAGALTHVLRQLGQQPTDIMTNPALFKPLVTAQVIWKDTGWGTIIYLAALLNIDPALYEAAVVDGAGRWRRMWYVTLPGIVPITILLLILRLGEALTVNFQQILLQRDSVGQAAGEVLDTYVYFHGIIAGDWGVAAAVGLVKGVVAVLLVVGANRLAHALGQEGLYTR